MQADGRSPTPSADELRSLLERSKNRDQAAFAELFHHTHRQVLSKVLAILRDEGLADDVVVETYAKAWERAEKFDSGLGSPLTWLLTIGTRLAIDKVRRLAARPGDRETDSERLAEAASSAFGPSEITTAADSRAQIRQAVDKLPQQQRVVIETAFFEGLSHSMTAKVLDIAPGTVKSRIRAGLIALRQALEPGEVEWS